MTLEQRVEKLERQNRWFKRGAALVVALAACGTLMAQKKEEEPRDLMVRSLQVIDGEGRIRCALRSDPQGMTGLHVLDRTGQLRASLGVLDDVAASLVLRDWEDHVLALVSVDATKSPSRTDQLKPVSRIVLRDESGEVIFNATGN